MGLGLRVLWVWGLGFRGYGWHESLQESPFLPVGYSTWQKHRCPYWLLHFLECQGVTCSKYICLYTQAYSHAIITENQMEKNMEHEMETVGSKVMRRLHRDSMSAGEY